MVEKEELIMERVLEQPMERNDCLLNDRNFETGDCFEWKRGNLIVAVELGNLSVMDLVDCQLMHNGTIVAVVVVVVAAAADGVVNTYCIDCM